MVNPWTKESVTSNTFAGHIISSEMSLSHSIEMRLWNFCDFLASKLRTANEKDCVGSHIEV